MIPKQYFYKQKFSNSSQQIASYLYKSILEISLCFWFSVKKSGDIEPSLYSQECRSTVVIQP